MSLNDRPKSKCCIVPACKGQRFNLVHKFPMENARTLQWLSALDIPHLYNVPHNKLSTSYFVCSRHFRHQDYKNPVSRYLNKTAVPSINLKSLNELHLMGNRQPTSSSSSSSSSSVTATRSIITKGVHQNVPESENNSSELNFKKLSFNRSNTNTSTIALNRIEDRNKNGGNYCNDGGIILRHNYNYSKKRSDSSNSINNMNNDDENNMMEKYDRKLKKIKTNLIKLNSDSDDLNILCSIDENDSDNNDGNDNDDVDNDNDDADEDSRDGSINTNENNENLTQMMEIDEFTQFIIDSVTDSNSNKDDKNDKHGENNDDNQNEFNKFMIETKINKKYKNNGKRIIQISTNHHQLIDVDDNNDDGTGGNVNNSENDEEVISSYATEMDDVTATTGIETESEAAVCSNDGSSLKNIFVMTSKYLKVKHPITSELISLDYFWLRDHCRCPLCFNYETNQRKYNILDIQLDTKPLLIEYKNNNNLYIKWDDEHESNYDIEFLFKSQFDYVKKNVPKQCLWDKKKILNEYYARIDFGQLVTDDTQIEKIVKSLITYGIAFIENVPATQDMTEMAIRRLFPIQKTFFGEMWTFGDTKNDNHSDTAYTKDYLEAHTDNTYLNDAAGLQIFHCLEHINGIGGETFLIDGYKIIQDLMKHNYDAYQKLVEINIPSEYIEFERYHRYTAPIIRLNNETKRPEQIRYNLYDRAVFDTIPQNEMREFYEHLRYLTKLIQNKDNQWKFKLNPGTVLIFDNWRILHGRESYTGHRKMSGCYVSRTEYLSKARILDLVR